MINNKREKLTKIATDKTVRTCLNHPIFAGILNFREVVINVCRNDEGVVKLWFEEKLKAIWQKIWKQNIFFFTLNIFEAAFDDDDLVVTDFALLASHKLFYCTIILIWFYAIKLTQNITTKYVSVFSYSTNVNFFRSFIRLNVIFILWHISKFSCLCFYGKPPWRNVFTFLETIYFYHQHKIEQIHYRKEWYR